MEETTMIEYEGEAFIDAHSNGAIGIDLGNPNLSISDIKKLVNFQFSQGVAMFFATLVSNTLNALWKSTQTIISARRTDPLVEFAIPVLHYEIFASNSPGARGAHKLDYFFEPKWEEYEKLFSFARKNNLKVMITIAPELNDAIEFIKEAVLQGIIVSIGHTNASPGQITAAVKAGASCITHLWNGAEQNQDRFEGTVFSLLACGLPACVITDGHHVPPTQFEITKRCVKDIAIVSDGTHLTGMASGDYVFNDQAVRLENNGRVTLLSDPRKMAGSSATVKKCLEAATSPEYGLDPIQGIMMVTAIPARIFGLQNEIKKTRLKIQWDTETRKISIISLSVEGESCI